MSRTVQCPHCAGHYCCKGLCGPKVEIKIDQSIVAWLKIQKMEGSADGEATGFEHQGTAT